MNPTSEDQKTIKKQLLSFKYAFNGIYQFIRSERHAKIHIPAAIIVIIISLTSTIGFGVAIRAKAVSLEGIITLLT